MDRLPGLQIGRRAALAAMGGGVLSSLAGCSLFKFGWDSFSEVDSKPGDSARPHTMPRPQDAIGLDIVHVERCVGDPLIGEALWSEVEQVGAIKPEVRAALRRAEFRVGHVGSAPPRALQQVLGLKSSLVDHQLGDQSHLLTGHRVTIRSGASTDIQTSDLSPHCSLLIEDREATRRVEFENARCQFRVTVRRQQDGWVTLEFLPEIHHGNHQLRRVATESGFGLRSTQEVESLYPQQFSITLNLGEMAVLGAGEGDADSLGQHFFHGQRGNEKIQRVIIVRLADMKKVQPLYVE